jgi:hypothetical protein
MTSRNIFLLAATLLSAGCGNGGSLCHQFELPAGVPAANIETLNKVCGAPRRNVVPAAAEAGNVWPQAPEHVPTSLDLLRETTLSGPAAAAQTRRHARGYGLCRPISRAAGVATAGAPAAPPGVALGLCYAPVVRGATSGRTGPA